MRIVSSVENPCKIGGPLEQNSIEAKTKFSTSDLLAVFHTDRRELVGEENSSFQEIDIPVKLELLGVEKRFRQ